MNTWNIITSLVFLFGRVLKKALKGSQEMQREKPIEVETFDLDDFDTPELPEIIERSMERLPQMDLVFSANLTRDQGRIAVMYGPFLSPGMFTFQVVWAGDRSCDYPTEEEGHRSFRAENDRGEKVMIWVIPDSTHTEGFLRSKWDVKDSVAKIAN